MLVGLLEQMKLEFKNGCIYFEGERKLYNSIHSFYSHFFLVITESSLKGTGLNRKRPPTLVSSNGKNVIVFVSSGEVSNFWFKFFFVERGTLYCESVFPEHTTH